MADQVSIADDFRQLLSDYGELRASVGECFSTVLISAFAGSPNVKPRIDAAAIIPYPARNIHGLRFSYPDLAM